MRSQKAQAVLWFYYVQPQPMRSQASHTACAAYAFKIFDFKKPLFYAFLGRFFDLKKEKP